MINYDCCRNSINPLNIFKWVKYKIDFSKKHPFYFNSEGLLMFVGPQGSGKSLSAVSYVTKLLNLYPKAKLVTNLELKDFPIVSYKNFILSIADEYVNFDGTSKELEKILFDRYLRENRVFEFENDTSLSLYNNDEMGVIFLIDEIQLYFNSLQSKNINPEVMAQISQQRKQRKHIVCTSQVFGRMAKPLREQFSNVIVCKNFLGFIQYNCLIDRDSISEFDNGTNLKGKIKKKFLWFHKPDFYGKYDTYKIIKNNKFVSNERKKVDIYDSKLSDNS